MFSEVSRNMGRITSMKKGKMRQRWVATALLNAEKKFRTVKGFLQILSLEIESDSFKKRVETKIFKNYGAT